MRKILHTPFFIKLFNWEYWNSAVVYAPLYPYYAWLSLKARSFLFLTAANPKIRNGGFIMESKKDVYDLLPAHYYPTTLYFQPETSFSEIVNKVKAAGIIYPLIAKPDIGERGLAVKKIENEVELKNYSGDIPVAFLIQEFVPYENEVGIFYCRKPGASKGYITGIVNKEPVKVTGDGVSTIAQLVKRNERYLLQLKQIQELNSDKMEHVLAVGRSFVLVPYGNHSRGSKFTDETYRITDRLSETIDRVCMQMPEFYYGRLDIRFNSWDELECGKSFSIIEVNGSGSEPTHIYDPKHSIFFAWREIIKHWSILYEISSENNKRGVQYVTLSAGWLEMNAFKQIDTLLSARTW